MPQNKPQGTVEPHGSTWMDVEPVDPRQGPIGGPGQPILRDGALPPNKLPGMPEVSIGPNPNALPGMRSKVKSAPGRPNDITRPKQSDVVKS
jgi:hypothetical protein